MEGSAKKDPPSEAIKGKAWARWTNRRESDEIASYNERAHEGIHGGLPYRENGARNNL